VVRRVDTQPRKLNGFAEDRVEAVVGGGGEEVEHGGGEEEERDVGEGPVAEEAGVPVFGGVDC